MQLLGNGTVQSKEGGSQTIISLWYILGGGCQKSRGCFQWCSAHGPQSMFLILTEPTDRFTLGQNGQECVPQLQLCGQINISYQHVTVTDLGKRTVRNDSVKELKVARERTYRSNSKAPHLYLYKSSRWSTIFSSQSINILKIPSNNTYTWGCASWVEQLYGGRISVLWVYLRREDI